MATKESLLERLCGIGYSIQSRILFVLLLGVTLLEFVQVILRYVLQMPLFGIEELLLFPTIWLYFLGGANASYERSHITCGVLSLYMKKQKTIALFNFTKSVIALIVCGWLTYWAFEYFQYSLMVGKQSATLYIPLIYGESALFIGLLLMSIYTAVELLSDFKELATTLSGSESE